MLWLWNVKNGEAVNECVVSRGPSGVTLVISHIAFTVTLTMIPHCNIFCSINRQIAIAFDTDCEGGDCLKRKSSYPTFYKKTKTRNNNNCNTNNKHNR